MTTMSYSSKQPPKSSRFHLYSNIIQCLNTVNISNNFQVLLMKLFLNFKDDRFVKTSQFKLSVKFPSSIIAH